MGIFDGVFIASDMDGTLLSSDHAPSRENNAAIEYFMAEGGRFALCTGRPYKTFKGIRGLLYNSPVVMANGALILDMDTKETLYSKCLDISAAATARDVIDRLPSLACEYYPSTQPDRVYISNINDISKMHMAIAGGNDYIIASPEEAPKPWFKMMFTGESATLDALHGELETECGFFVTRSYKHYLEVLDPGVNKGVAVIELAKRLGISNEHVYTIGDQHNDIAMLSAAHISFAPANATDEIKAAVDVLLPSNDEHAVMAMIEYLRGIYGG